jgi:NTP pyrophosphatase (non-canonical NTP hydrolase)
MIYEIEAQSEKIEQSVKIIQKIFDDYQNLCFTKRSSEFFCLELNGEAGELANLEKKSWKGKAVKQELFFDEAADVLIALMNYSNAKGVDLGKAVKDKLLQIEEKRITLLENGESY